MPMDRHTTTTLSPGRPSLLAIVVLFIILVVLLVAALDALGSETPATGDWEIDDMVVIAGYDTVVTGNITVHSGGQLLVQHLSLYMNMTSHGQFRITVEEGGRLFFYHVLLDSLDLSSRFNLTIKGTAHINASTIRRMDGPETPNPLSNPQGLVVESSSVQIIDSIISDCGGFAMTVEPGSVSDVDPLIEGCTIEDNDGGIYCGGVLLAKGNARIVSCNFARNSLGDIVAIAADPVISDCSFQNSLLGWGLTGVSALALAGPTIEMCDFQFYFAAINSVYAEPKIRDCTMNIGAAGMTVIGADPLIVNVTITNFLVPMNLTGTFAEVRDCSISGFTTAGFAVMVDGGRPMIDGLTVDLSLVGGAISMVNGTRAVITDSGLYGTGLWSVVAVEDSRPTMNNCVIEGGTNGIELVDSPAIIERCTILNNGGWGIASYFEDFTNRDNEFGTGGDVNTEGRVIQYYWLEVLVEHGDGSPAADATVSLTDAMDELWGEVASDSEGLAFDDMYPEYEITNANRTITYAPYTASAVLGDLTNTTTFGISDNPLIVLVLEPPLDLPPLVVILSPLEGTDYDVFELGNRVPFEGTVVDPEGGAVTWAWYVDGEKVNDQELAFDLELAPGTHEVALMGSDEGRQEVWLYLNVTVVSVPPSGNHVTMISPMDGSEFDMGEEVVLTCEYYVLDHPELEGPVPLPVTWTSDIDGLMLEAEGGELANLTPGEHVLTVAVWPRYPQFIPGPYHTNVSIVVLPPEPVAVAVISSPEDGAEFRWDAVVHLAANGSYLDIWNPPEYRTIYRWFSDIDGILGEGRELDARHLITGAHTITLLLTTDPLLVSNETTITIIMHPEPDHPPVARISVLMNNLTAGEPVYLTARLSVDPEGEALTYHWELGDGNSSTSVDVNHTYAEAGNYTVRLTVFDGLLEGVDMLFIQVHPADDGGNGGNGDGGDGNGGDGNGGDDDGTVEASDTWIGWVFILLLFAALGALLYLWSRGKPRE